MSRSPKRSVILPPDARRTASGSVPSAQCPCASRRRQAGSSFLKKTEKARFSRDAEDFVTGAAGDYVSSAFGSFAPFMHSVIFSTAVRNAFDLLSLR